jgi:hypothetical protein
MTEVTGVIIARVVAMITVVTITTLTMKDDVTGTEKGVGMIVMVGRGMIGLEGIDLRETGHLGIGETMIVTEGGETILTENAAEGIQVDHDPP